MKWGDNMKKIVLFLFTVFTAAQIGFMVSAQEVVPTGERTNILPYIFGIVALILIVAVGWLTYLGKKNNK